MLEFLDKMIGNISNQEEEEGDFEATGRINESITDRDSIYS